MADKEIVDEGREKFSSRLGFILISAGCAIGLGNIWRFLHHGRIRRGGIRSSHPVFPGGTWRAAAGDGVCHGPRQLSFASA